MTEPVVFHRRLLIADYIYDKLVLIADARASADNRNPTMLNGEFMLDRTGTDHYMKVGKPGDATKFNDSDRLVYLNPEKYVPPVVDTTFSDIRAALEAGTVATDYPLGDQIVTTYTDPGTSAEYELPWDIVSYRKVTTQDGVEHDAVILQAHYAIPTTNLQFDAPEPSNSDSSRRSYGSNRYSQSAIRQWLNSDAEATAGWWTAQTSTDVAPTNPATWLDWPGFLKCLPESMASFLQPVRVKTATADIDSNVVDTTYDKMWLPSKEELYSVVDTSSSVNISGVEGPYWEYWKTRVGTSSPAADDNSTVNSKRSTYAIENPTSTSMVRLRSAYRSYSDIVWLLGGSGYLYSGYAANTAIRATPACAIF